MHTKKKKSELHRNSKKARLQLCLEPDYNSAASSNKVSDEHAKLQSKLQNCEVVRKKQLLQGNEEEDKSIKRLEKLLKLKKKKSKTDSKKKIPSAFIDDGLDYLLEVLDKKDGKTILSDDSADLEEDLAIAQDQLGDYPHRKKQKNHSMLNLKRKRTLTQLMEEKGGKVVETRTDDFSNESDSDFGNSSIKSVNTSAEDSREEYEDEGEEENIDESKKKKIPKVWEDIYGRLRDESGNVLKNEKQEKYVPPSLRKNIPITEKQQEQLQKIKRQLKGLLNRLSESNIQPICHQIEEMYMKNSRNDMNETLFSVMSDLIFTPILTPPRLILEQTMLIALLHANIGMEVGAFFLQHLIQRLEKLFKSFTNYGEGKECNNILIFLSHLYNFKVTHSTLIFDIFHHLIESFQEKDIELLQLMLKSIGFVLRKDDPLKLKEIILSIQNKASTVKREENDSRTKFMIETLTAIRNNNIYKIPDYDPTIVQHGKKLLKGLIRKGCSLQELSVSFEDLLKAEERGRWWIVGSAWSEKDSNQLDGKNDNPNTVLSKTEASEKILELAQKQHMNTDVRKSVFCIIMTAEDYMDAFEKLLKLNLKNQQEREIINVVLHCALQEQTFNPYYAYLAGKFCNFARKYQMCLQFSLWDKFKELSKMKTHKLNNLAHFLSHIFISGALPLSVLKVIHFSEMDKSMVRFFRQILLAILLHDSEEVCCQVFKRISVSKNLNLLREGLRLFMHHFLLKNQSKLEADIAQKLSERVKLAENSLNAGKNAFKL